MRLSRRILIEQTEGEHPPPVAIKITRVKAIGQDRGFYHRVISFLSSSVKDEVTAQ